MNATETIPSPIFMDRVRKHARVLVGKRLDDLMRSGLLRLAIQHEEARERKNERPLRSAQDVLMERVVLWAGLAGTWLQRPEKIECAGIDPNGADMAIGSFLALMDGATPYLWKDDMRLAAVSDRNTLPSHVTADLHLPHSVMWWSWAEGLKVGTLSPQGRMNEYVGREGLGSLVFRLVDTGITNVEVAQLTKVVPANEREELPWFYLAFYTLPGGERYPEDLTDGTQKYKHETLAKLLAFLASPFVESHPERLARQVRHWREIKATALLDTIQVVSLRRADIDNKQPLTNEQRDWHFRWLVSGHYRNQWYPSNASHKLIWIAPYMKGPEDKPLLPKVYKVVR